MPRAAFRRILFPWDEMARKASPREQTATPHPWRRVAVWAGATAGAAVIGLAVTGIVQSGEHWFAGATTSGPPVAVHLDPQPGEDDVSLPVGQSLSGAEVKALSAMDVRHEDAWLVAHKHGVVTSDAVEALAVTGNRQDPVRIVGMSITSDCRAPSRGTLVRQAVGRGGGVDSESMTFYPEESDPGPFSFTTAGVKKDYFPARTIVLKQGEQVVVDVDVAPGRTEGDSSDPAAVRACDVGLTMTVLTGGSETTEAVPGTLRVMDIEPEAADADYRGVYVGTGICDALYAAPAGWHGDAVAACGAGHVTDGAG